MRCGLRVDADTLRGTRLGVPSLVEAMGRRGVRATFFMTVGPDNMGRHLWRLFKPAFLWKMLRTRAPSLYGWDILRCGVLGTGPDIGRLAADEIRLPAAHGHEVGLHAWDHHAWQSMDLADGERVRRETRLGLERLTEILGRRPDCSAAPAWRADFRVLAIKEEFGFRYNSDSRGRSCFRPVDRDGRALAPQVPVTLPTYDETLGVDGVDDAVYNERLLARFRPGALNTLCVHAEVEGVAKAELFGRFLDEAARRGLEFVPLGELLPEPGACPAAEVTLESVPGRAGAVCTQQ